MTGFDKFINSLKEIGQFVAYCSPIIIAYFAYKQNKMKKAVDEGNIKTDSVDTKVEAYHKEVDGKMGILLEKTEALGKKQGAEDNQAKTDAKPQDQK